MPLLGTDPLTERLYGVPGLPRRAPCLGLAVACVAGPYEAGLYLSDIPPLRALAEDPVFLDAPFQRRACAIHAVLWEGLGSDRDSGRESDFVPVGEGPSCPRTPLCFDTEESRRTIYDRVSETIRAAWGEKLLPEVPESAVRAFRGRMTRIPLDPVSACVQDIHDPHLHTGLTYALPDRTCVTWDGTPGGTKEPVCSPWMHAVLGAGHLVLIETPRVRLDDRKRLHNDRGPAVRWGDGTAQWSWHGVPVDRDVIERPESITPARVLAEPNAELRRILIERRGGMSWLLAQAGLVLDEDSDSGGPRRLVHLQLPGEREPYAAVLVRCPSTGREYALRVPPACRTCAEAVAWTFNVPAGDYRPVKET